MRRKVLLVTALLAACCLHGTSAEAAKAAKAKGRGKGKGQAAAPWQPTGFNLIAMGGYESVQYETDDASEPLTGFAFLGGGQYGLSLSPQMTFDAGVVLHYASLTASQDSASIVMTPMTAGLLTGVNYFVSKQMAIGAGLGYDLFTLGGSVEVTLDDELAEVLGETSISGDVKSFSRLELLGRFSYFLSKTMAINAEAGMLSGDYVIALDGETGDTVKFDGFTMRGGLRMWL